MNEKSLLHSLIENPHEIANLSYSEISKILQKTKDILERENLLLEINVSDPDNEVYVIGDIHGNLQSLLKIYDLIKENKPHYIIFLGDLVDRGPHQLECLITILCLKIIEPYRFYILRGNHETLEMNKAYGFFYEFIQKFQDVEKITEILSVYDLLPICSKINDKILCLHGGIPLEINVINEFKDVKTINKNDSIGISLYQIMWNDPKEEIEGFKQSFRGPGIFFFGEDVFNNFLTKNKLKYVIRSHESFPEGYKWFFNNRLLSIFSSENYRGKDFPSPASYAIIKNNKVIAKILNT